MEAQITTGVKKVIDGWTATFTIGVQTFSLLPVETKEHAQWYQSMLKKAFENIGNNALDPVELLNFVGANYDPINGDGAVMWNLDGPEVLYTSEEVYEHFLEEEIDNTPSPVT